MRFSRWFNKINTTHSLRSQIIAGFTIITILGVTVVGMTALTINYRYLENEKRQQSLSMVTEFYQSKETQLTDMVVMTASHLALESQEKIADPDTLQSYLNQIHRGLPKVDSLIYCDQTGQIVTFSGVNIPLTNCNLETNPLYITLKPDGESQVWMLRGRKLADQNSNSGMIILGIQMDNQLLMEMCDQCDLYHSLLQNGEVIATSFGSILYEKTNIKLIPSNLTNDEFQKSYVMQGHQYYVSNFPLNGMGLEVEVALDVTSYHQDHRQQELILTFVIIAVVLVSILFGAFLAQLILRPLSQLVAATNYLEELDLSKPIQVKTKIQEVIELSQVLENSRTRIDFALSSLQKETQWNELLLEAIVEGIIVLLDETIEYFSPGAERITGWKQDEVVGQLINTVLVAADQSNPCFSLHSPPGEKIRCKFILRNSEIRILSITIAHLPINDFDKPQTVLVLRDVNQEEELSHLLGSFLGNITHEFRTPLTALAASIEILLDEAEDLDRSEMKELLTSIHLSTLNLENLIDNLLEGSSIETGRFRVNPHPVDISIVIHSASETISPLLRKYGQKLQIDLPENLPIVMIDEKRINQVLLNIIANASKYGPKDAEIFIYAKIKIDSIEINIGDHGKGVPEPYREKIFSGYVLANNDEGRTPRGTGLGLSVSQTIIKAHGGRMGVRDRPGGGSEFWFTIPIIGEK